MREIVGHTAGKIFLLVLLVSVVAMFLVPQYFYEPRLVFGWVPLPFAAGIAFLCVWLVAYLIYFFFYWPFRR
ncbi:MAG: hypothetical protein GF418_07295 [Chitinivibrionales bacterium]|nr:hypothetical protein [Chitinivibrionales bacterium]MBD3395416.1 hypothetical protein [Chitinivibrionales bacterium]